MGRYSKVKTDHDSLKYFLEQILSSKEQQKWVTKMLGYDFEIIYKKGKQNVVADALSRKDEDVEAFLCAISIIQPYWINETREEWKNDEEMWALIRNLKQDSSTSNTFIWKNILYGTKIAYTSVRIPNSNKRFLWNCTLLP